MVGPACIEVRHFPFKSIKYLITIFWVCWTNLKSQAIVGFPWPIHILAKV